MRREPVPQRQRFVGQCSHFDVGSRHAGPGVAIDDHRPLGPSRPASEASGPADALHGLITLVLFVVAVWPAGAHGSAGGVDDATAPVWAGSVWWSSAN